MGEGVLTSKFQVLFTHKLKPQPNYFVMVCGAAEATGLDFVCFAVLSPRVLAADRVDSGFCFCNKVPLLSLFYTDFFSWLITLIT